MVSKYLIVFFLNIKKYVWSFLGLCKLNSYRMSPLKKVSTIVFSALQYHIWPNFPYYQCQESIAIENLHNSKIVKFCPKNISRIQFKYSEVPNRRADRNKRAGLEKSGTLLACLLSKLINEQGGIFCSLHEELRTGWK